jgi:hypothetical protein
VNTQNRRITISCNAWPGVVPKECMQEYGKKIKPFLQLLLHKGFELNPAADDSNERALYRSTIPYFQKNSEVTRMYSLGIDTGEQTPICSNEQTNRRKYFAQNPNDNLPFNWGIFSGIDKICEMAGLLSEIKEMIYGFSIVVNMIAQNTRTSLQHNTRVP